MLSEKTEKKFACSCFWRGKIGNFGQNNPLSVCIQDTLSLYNEYSRINCPTNLVETSSIYATYNCETQILKFGDSKTEDLRL